jgi:hypothetical protein
VGATGIEPVTPAMSTQLPPLKSAEIHWIAVDPFSFRSTLVHANLGPTWGARRSFSNADRRLKNEIETLALLGCHDVNATRHLGYLFAVTFRAPYLRCLVLCDGFGALK